MMKKHYVSAEDINRLFYAPKRKRRFPSWQVISASLLIFFGVFFLFNAPSLTEQLRYWWESDIQQSKQLQQSAVVPVVSQASPVVGATAQPSATTILGKAVVAFNPATMKDNSLYVPKIKVSAPVVWDVTGGDDLNADMLKALQRGVVRYPQTALPNQIGNVFLTGHSSNYWWEKGGYKTIFALLDRLVVGDIIYVKYNGTLYTYKVNGQKVVKPNETSVLDPTKTPTLSLMTCTPTGTSLLRRIVTASLVSPIEGLSPQPTAPKAGSLEAVR